MKIRKINDYVPVLRNYLRPGMDVLDVGCGKGLLSVDIARAVAPGQVTGIDCSVTRIKQAVKFTVAQGLRPKYFVQDAASLEFSDNQFDLVFSQWVLEWLPDPVSSLKEQLRVVKPGGMVVSHSSDWSGALYYPECPAIERFHRAASRLSHPDTTMARSLPGLFRRAGMKNIQVQVNSGPAVCYGQGSEFFQAEVERLQGLLYSAGDGSVPLVRKLIEMRAIDERLLTRMRAEFAVWQADPDAHRYGMFIVCAGLKKL